MEARKNINATCPECRGPLSRIQEGEIVQYTCLVGHIYSPAALLQEHSQAQETALWMAVVSLEESAALVEDTASQFLPEVAERLAQQATVKQSQAMTIRRILRELEPFQT